MPRNGLKKGSAQAKAYMALVRAGKKIPASMKKGKSPAPKKKATSKSPGPKKKKKATSKSPAPKKKKKAASKKKATSKSPAPKKKKKKPTSKSPAPKKKFTTKKFAKKKTVTFVGFPAKKKTATFANTQAGRQAKMKHARAARVGGPFYKALPQNSPGNYSVGRYHSADYIKHYGRAAGASQVSSGTVQVIRRLEDHDVATTMQVAAQVAKGKRITPTAYFKAYTKVHGKGANTRLGQTEYGSLKGWGKGAIRNHAHIGVYENGSRAMPAGLLKHYYNKYGHYPPGYSG